MRRISATLFLFTVIYLFIVPLHAFGVAQSEEYSPVVATTSWTAAFAIAAGAEDVHVLAPYEMRHPAEYELAPSDIAVIANSRYIVFAGYEGSVPRIKEAIGSDGPELIQITTDFSLETLETSILKIADLLGTDAVARRSIAEIADFYADWRKELAGLGLSGVSVITHVFHRPLAVVLGAEVLGVYGPAPLEARQIVELSELNPELIVDNYHNDVGKPLRETMGQKRVAVAELVNFPGVAGTVSLIDVLRENRRRVRELME